jgi:hypothetical protein
MSPCRSEQARNLYLNPHHSDILFRLIVVKRDVFIPEKLEDIGFVKAEDICQFVAFGFYFPYIR